MTNSEIYTAVDLCNNGYLFAANMNGKERTAAKRAASEGVLIKTTMKNMFGETATVYMTPESARIFNKV